MITTLLSALAAVALVAFIVWNNRQQKAQIRTQLKRLQALISETDAKLTEIDKRSPDGKNKSLSAAMAREALFRAKTEFATLSISSIPWYTNKRAILRNSEFNIEFIQGIKDVLEHDFPMEQAS